MKLLTTLILILALLAGCTKQKCSNGKQDKKEDGVDCGGPCEMACPTCVDGILNQDEIEIDCGGATCDACPPTYSETGLHGLNILQRIDTATTDTMFIGGADYSVAAAIPVGTTVKIVFTRISGHDFQSELGTANNWSFTSTGDVFTFQNINPGNADAKFTLPPPDFGVFLIQYFENGDVETQRRVVTWD